MKWNLILPAIDEIPIIRGAGVPTGTPPFNGARYLDTSTGVVYLGRNVLNFNGSSISIPLATGVRKVRMKFWHNDPTPSSDRIFYCHNAFDPAQISVRRVQTSGNIAVIGATPLAGNVFTLDGTVIGNGLVNPSASVWHNLEQSVSVDAVLNRMPINSPQSLIGRMADIQIFGAGDVLLRSYAINEGSGSTIIDSVSGQNGTLTIGSGSWELTWVSQN